MTKHPDLYLQQPPASAKDSPYMAWTGDNEGKRDEEKFGGKNTGPKLGDHHAKAIAKKLSEDIPKLIRNGFPTKALSYAVAVKLLELGELHGALAVLRQN